MMPEAGKQDINIFTNNPETPIIEASYENEVGNFPTATALSVFDIFPDVYNGIMRYITHRKVTSLEGFYDAYKVLIESDTNMSPFKDYVEFITLNENTKNSDYRDFGIIKDQIHQQINSNFQKEDVFPDVFSKIVNTSNNGITGSHDSDSNVTEGLIECLYYVDNTNIVLHANGIPVYI